VSAQYQLTSIQKRYGTKIALELDELAIWPGRLYVLTGLNGSGKSTLLNILAFLSPPSAGEVSFAGQRVTWQKRQLGLLRRRVTLVHQSPYLFAGTVAGNIAFGLKARGLERRELRWRVGDSLAKVGLAGFEGRKIGQLSGGEAQRVALARALALQPEVLLLDEPLANVDKETTQILQPLLAALPAAGTTVVMSTHDPRLDMGADGNTIQLSNGKPESGNSRNRPSFRWETDPLLRGVLPRD
jgi:tungstate transport system ATP-binding protein